MSLSEARLLDDIRQRFFSPMTPGLPRAVGVELEVIPVYASTRLPALPKGGGDGSTTAVLSRLARMMGWIEEPAGNDPPSWRLADGTSITFEPGGQIEISSAPHPTASSVVRATRSLMTTIRAAMTSAGVELLACGVDPHNGIEAVPLQLERDRYTRMTRYFDSIGPSGVRMMRQTAALQINVERGTAPALRWNLLNALAPYIVALFSNSRAYAGKPTGYASYRAHLWRTLDRSRTGLPCDPADPAVRYLAFALDALAMRSSDGGRPWLSFRDWILTEDPDEDEWIFHLSTLFPEIRPREFFEIRSADAIDDDWLAAPVAFITGLVYDDETASSAAALAGPPSEALLDRAGRLGLADPELARIAARLAQLSLAGARRLGENYLSATDVSTAHEYLRRILRRSGIQRID